jgi:predicted transposase/invertase (TIGR01784 family)
MAMTAKTKNTKEQEELLRNLPERLDIRIDWAFRHFFYKKAHLIKIIKDLLDMDIEVIEYMPNTLDVISGEDKKSVFDVICKNTQTGEIFVLEMQTTYESDMSDRLYYYGGSLIHNQMASGDKVYAIKSVLICCIASYRVPHREKVPEGKVFFQYKMMEKETHEVFDGDKLNICFLELQRFDNYLDKGADLRRQWCWIFNNLPNFVHRPEHLDSSFDDIIQDAGTQKLTTEQKLKYMEALHLSERERKVIYEGGIIVGREEGRSEMRLEAARALFAEGVPIETIAKALSLTEEEMGQITGSSE